MTRPGIDLTLQELLKVRTEGKLKLQRHQSVQASLAGRYRSSAKGRGMEFDEVRHYQQGDDIRTIDWRVTARTGKAHTKLFREEREQPVIIMVDLSSSMCFGSQLQLKSHQASLLAAYLAWHAKLSGDKVGAMIFSDTKNVAWQMRPKQGTKTLMTIFQQLIQFHHSLIAQLPFRIKQAASNQYISNNNQFILQLARLNKLIKSGTQLHLVSDFSQMYNKETVTDSAKNLYQLACHNQVQAWHIFDPIEFCLPSNITSGTLAVTNGRQTGQLQLGSKGDQNNYQKAAKQRHDKLKKIFKQHKIPLEQISTAYSLKAQSIYKLINQHS